MVIEDTTPGCARHRDRARPRKWGRGRGDGNDFPTETPTGGALGFGER